MTDTKRKPAILLIPGAWHTGNTFEPVADILRAQGYKAETITLPSAGGPANITAHDDVEHIRKRYLNELVAQGREVILVMHSYAGIPGTESVKGFARKDLAAQDKQGGVVGLVYQAAFLVPAGASVESFLPGGLDPFMTLKDGKMYPKNPRESFYNDMDDETAAKHLAAMVHHSPEVMRTSMTYEAWREVPTSYILCTLDSSFSAAAQQMVAGIPGEGVVRTYSVDGGHFAMLSQPQAVADIIQEIVTSV